MSLPEVLHYRQRRSDHRVKVGNAHIIPVHLGLEETVVQGQLWDISAGGVSIRLTEPLPYPLAQGDIIPSCAINLNPAQAISSGLEIRLLRHDEPRGQWVLGGRFIGLIPVHRKGIERFVASLDRELCKKLMKY
ncbi:MAG: PilZ domain-containing protein [Gammaproteobacteria bacterium]